MRRWPVQDAKARFSELVNASLADGPQMVTRRGEEAVVVLPVSEWRRLQRTVQPSLKDLLLAPEARGDIPVPARGKLRRRVGTPPD